MKAEEEECDHSDICLDEFYCTICGKDMLEAAKEDAFDRMKDVKKYGE